MLPIILSKFRFKSLVYYQNGPIDSSSLDAGSSSDQWVLASESSINQLFASDRSRRRRFLRFLRSGGLGLFLVRNGEWISYGWTAQPHSKGIPPHLPRWVLHLGNNWIFYCHTREAFRGQGIYKRLIAQLVSHISARTPDAVIFLDTAPNNVQSNRAVIRTGFSPSGVIVTYKLWVPFVGSLALGGRWLREQPHFPQYLPQNPAVEPRPATSGLSQQGFGVAPEHAGSSFLAEKS
jgi:RimJ/RimL family protein N-acetyltransferase